MGELSLLVAERGGRSVAAHQYHQGALRVLRPHYLDDSGQVCYVVVNPGGAYLGADLYVIDVEVADGAKLLLTTQSATKIYRTPGSFAEQRMSLRLGEGAQLELAPDQLIAYREASYRQNTHITLHPTSSLVMSEVITPGWSPDGASFRYEELRLRTEIQVESAGRQQAAGPGQPADPAAAARRHRHGVHGGLQPSGITDGGGRARGPGARRRTACADRRARRLHRGLPDCHS